MLPVSIFYTVDTVGFDNQVSEIRKRNVIFYLNKNCLFFIPMYDVFLLQEQVYW